MLTKNFLTKRELLFYIAFIIFIIALVLDRTMWAREYEMFAISMKFMRYIAYAICAVSILGNIYEKSKLFTIIAIFLICVLSYLGSNNITMLLYSLIFFAAYKIKENKIILVSFVTQSIILFFVVFLSQIGIIEDYIFTMDNRPRHALGFSWTTTSAILFTYLVFQYNCIRKNKITYVEIIVIEMLNYYFYKMTDSRMAFYLTTLFLLCLCIVKLLGFKFIITRKCKKLIYGLPSFIAVGAIGLHAIYNPENFILLSLNKLLSGRLRLGRQGIEEYGIKFWGQPIKWIGYSVEQATETVKYNYVDCSYLQILLEYGLIFLFLVLVIYTVILYKAIKSENYFIVWSVLFVLVFSITEPRLMNLSFNPFSVLLMSNMEVDQFKMSIFRESEKYKIETKVNNN